MQCFIHNSIPYLLIGGDKLIRFNQELTRSELILIENFGLVNKSPRFANPSFSINSISGKSDSNLYLKCFGFNSSGFNNGYLRKLAILEIDNEGIKARWKNQNKLPWYKKKNPIYSRELDINSFVLDPNFKSNKSAPIIFNTLIKNEVPYIFSIGNINTKSSAQSFSCLTKLNLDLSVKEHLFIEKHCLKDDFKKRGKNGIFTNSTKYCIISPTYIKSDSWEGKQKLFDLESSRFIEIKKPRGFSKFKLFDHSSEYYYLDFYDRKTKIQSLIKCNAV